MLRLPEGEISDAAAASAGLERIRTQRERVLNLALQNLDVDWIFERLSQRVPKSSIRVYLGRASVRGEIGDGWRKRRKRHAAVLLEFANP